MADSALEHQEGGDHYKGFAIQPWEYTHANELQWAEGEVVKYVTRWRLKGGLGDLRKARHILELLIEAEQKEKVKRDAIDEAYVEAQRMRPFAEGPYVTVREA